jgi:hypothetical protein
MAIKFSGGYDSSRMPRITTRSREETGKITNPEAHAAHAAALHRFESPETQAALKKQGWTDKQISDLINHHRLELANTERQHRTIVTPNGLEIPIRSNLNVGGNNNFGLSGHIGVGLNGLRFANPMFTASHAFGNGSNLGLHFSPNSAGISFQKSWGKSKEEKERDSGNNEGLAAVVVALLSYAWDKIGTKYKNDKLHGELQKNPPPLIKEAWKIGLKNLHNNDIFSLVSAVEKARDEIYAKTKDKNNGAYHFFSQELKHFYAERIRRAKGIWADTYVKNWAEGKHPHYENFLREKLENDLQNPDVKKHIGEPHWNNPNDWRMVERAKDWIHNWGTPERLETHYKNFSDEHNAKIENAFNTNLDELSKGHPDGFRDFLQSQFDLESLKNSTPENVNDLFAGLKNNNVINEIRGNFDTQEAEKILENERAKNSQEAKTHFGNLIWSQSHGYHDDIKEDFKNYLKSHFDLDSLDYATKKDVDDAWGQWAYNQNGLKKAHDDFLSNRRTKIFDDVISHLNDEPEFRDFVKTESNNGKDFAKSNFIESGRSNEEVKKPLEFFFGKDTTAQMLPTYRQKFSALQEKKRNETQQQQQPTPTATPIAFAHSPTVSQPQNETIDDDVDIARQQQQVRNFDWNKFNPIPKLSSYYDRMRNYYHSNNNNENDDVDLRRLQNQHGKLVQSFTIPKHYPTTYLEDKPDDSFQELTTKARLRLLQNARRYYPQQREKLKVNKPPEMKMRDMINLQRNEI